MKIYRSDKDAKMVSIERKLKSSSRKLKLESDRLFALDWVTFNRFIKPKHKECFKQIVRFLQGKCDSGKCYSTKEISNNTTFSQREVGYVLSEMCRMDEPLLRYCISGYYIGEKKTYTNYTDNR
jgi:hypothetical protein